MNNLVAIKGNDVFTDTLVIANETDNQHHTVTRKIRDNLKEFKELGKVKFMDDTSINKGRGRKKKIYLLNEPQASFLITLLENNAIVRRFKLALVKEFYRMRAILTQRQSTEWLETRKNGKLVRRGETDVLAELQSYAVNQGSKTYAKDTERLYQNYTLLVNRAVGIKKGERETTSAKILNTIAFIEDMILHTVAEEMQKGTFYKEIYQVCKKNTQMIVKLAFLPDRKLLVS